MCDEKKAFDPNVTGWLGWAYLIATLLNYFIFFIGSGMLAFLGDHSVYTVCALGWAMGGVEEASVWFSILKICGYLAMGLFFSVIPVCVAAIWKKKELPLLIFDMANMVDVAILAADVIVYNGFTSDALSGATFFVIHILGNAGFFVLLLRQYRAKRIHLRETAGQCGLPEQ